MADVAAEIEERLHQTFEYVTRQDGAAAIRQARLAHAILDEILDYLKPGIRESEVKAFALECFKKHGIERTWHAPYIRFGQHTLLTFLEKTTDDLTLQQEDIAFVDIGIVREGVEGDAGRTLVFGSNPAFHALRAASEYIFKEARAFWKDQNPPGIALYEFIHATARKLGVVFNLDPAGHLIGAFPHRGWKKGINHFPQPIAPGCWILEIQIRHPELPYGAFYEDLLY